MKSNLTILHRERDELARDFRALYELAKEHDVDVSEFDDRYSVCRQIAGLE